MCPGIRRNGASDSLVCSFMPEQSIQFVYKRGPTTMN